MYRHAKILFFFLSLVLILPFQNCAPEMGFEATQRSVSSILPDDNGVFEIVDTPPPPEIPKAISQFSPPLMDRQVVEGVLTNAFGPSFRSVDSFAVRDKGPEFGKRCSFYETHRNLMNGVLRYGTENCRVAAPNFVDTLATQGSTPSRSSYMMKICSDLVTNTTTLNHFMNKVGNAQQREHFEANTILNAYHLFYVGKPAPSSSLIQAIRFVGENQSSQPLAWSAIAFTLCSSEQWQVL